MTVIEDQVAGFLAEKRPGRGDVGSQATLSSYEMTVERIFLPWAVSQGITDAREITVAQWNSYVDELRSRPIAIQSVLTYLRGAKVFLRWLDLPDGVFKKLNSPKPPRLLLDILSREEIDHLEATAGNERDKLIVRLLADTGIRLSELTGLEMSDLLEFTSPIRYYCIRVLGKGSKEREVVVEQSLFKRLKKFAASGGKRTYVFPALQHDHKTGELAMLDGPRLTTNAVDKMFRELKKLSGITKKCTPHKLRHAYATYALQKGMAIEKLQRDLGHANLSMIINVYSHLTTVDRVREHQRVFGAVEPVVTESRKRRRIA